MTPATYNLPTARRGNTFPQYQFTVLDSSVSPGTAITVSDARMQIRTTRNELVNAWSVAAGSMTITGAGSNVVTALTVPSTTTSGWQVGTHRYDLEVTIASGVATLIAGTVQVEADVTQ